MADRDEHSTPHEGRTGRDGEPQTTRLPADSGRSPEHRQPEHRSDDRPAGYDPYNDDVQNDATVGGEPTDRDGTETTRHARSDMDSDQGQNGERTGTERAGNAGTASDRTDEAHSRSAADVPTTTAAPVVVAESRRSPAATVQVGKPLKPAAGMMGAGLALLLIGMVLALVPPVLVNMLMPMMGAAGGGSAMQIIMAVMIAGYLAVFIGLVLVAIAVVRLVRVADLKARQANAEADVIR